MSSAILAGQHALSVSASAPETANALRELTQHVGIGGTINRQHPNLTDMLEPTAGAIIWWQRGSRGIWHPSQQLAVP